MSELLPCPFCGSTRAPEVSDVGDCEECANFDDCLRRQENHTCEGCDEWERPMFVVCNYNISGCGVSGPYRKTKAEAIAAWNSRAERTCHIEWRDDSHDTDAGYERGVPYETNDDMGASETRWNGFTAYQLTPNAKLMMHPTPEQAIAATLGSGNKSRWHELFGTPERAAETLKRMDVDACNWCVNSSGNPEDCRACPYKYDYYGCYLPEKFSMLEWLKSEVVE